MFRPIVFYADTDVLWQPSMTYPVLTINLLYWGIRQKSVIHFGLVRELISAVCGQKDKHTLITGSFTKTNMVSCKRNMVL